MISLLFVSCAEPGMGLANHSCACVSGDGGRPALALLAHRAGLERMRSGICSSSRTRGREADDERAGVPCQKGGLAIDGYGKNLGRISFAFTLQR